MPAIAKHVADLPDSATVRIADLAAAMRARGEEVLDLSAGRAAEHTPAAYVETAVSSMRAGDTHQTPARGTPAYLAACARKLARENHLEVDPQREILATLGCKQGLGLALSALLDPGDEVVVEDPGFVSYSPSVALAGGVPVPVPLHERNAYRWTSEDLESALTPRTRAVLFCSPHNPTGVVHRREDLQVIADFALRNDLFIIVDEIYERTTWGGSSHVCIASLDGMQERTIGLMGLTKTASMGGWRIGFAYGPEPAITAMERIQQHAMTCASSIGQSAATHAFGEPPVPEMLDFWGRWEERCRLVTNTLDGLPGLHCAMPEGGFYAWLDIRSTGIPSTAMAQRLLEEAKVAVVPGVAFGTNGEGFLRITCVRSDHDIAVALERMVAFFSGLDASRGSGLDAGLGHGLD